MGRYLDCPQSTIPQRFLAACRGFAHSPRGLAHKVCNSLWPIRQDVNAAGTDSDRQTIGIDIDIEEAVAPSGSLRSRLAMFRGLIVCCVPLCRALGAQLRACAVSARVLSFIYLVNSGPDQILRMEFDADSGEIGAPDSWLEPRDGHVDGIASDLAGGLWVAMWGAGELHRYDRAGKHVAVVRVPTSQVTAACFAGTRLQTLAITTAARDMAPGHLAGTVFRVDVPIRADQQRSGGETDGVHQAGWERVGAGYRQLALRDRDR